jgi:hypothetical protein
MRFIGFLIMCFYWSVTIAADWDLFPKNQKSYFLDSRQQNKNYVDLYVMDSVKVNGQDTLLLFRKNLDLKGAGKCYVDTLQNMKWPKYNLLYNDKLVQRNDTVFFHSTFSTSPFYFLPRAAVGQSWTVTSSYSGNQYGQITITCASIQVQTFLGVTDSVKTFTMVPNGSSPNQVPVSNFVMRLSKNHGFVEFVPFILFHYHPPGVDFFSAKLIGKEHQGNSTGYRQPKFNSYFPLSVGDILLWRQYDDPAWTHLPKVTTYYRDSITTVTLSPDSIVYQYDRLILGQYNVITQYTGMTTKYITKDFINILETPPRWVGLGNNEFNWFIATPHITLWSSDYLFVSTDTLSGDTISTFEFTGDGSFVDTSQCNVFQVFDLGYSFTMSTKAGLTHHCVYNFGSYCTTLTGYRINGKQTGSITLSLPEHEGDHFNILKIYPNPAGDIIYLENIPTGNSTEYSVYSSTGQKMKQGRLTGNKIEIQDLSKGLHFIRILGEAGFVTGRFVKE